MTRSAHRHAGDVLRSYADAEPWPFWLSQPGAPEPGPPLEAADEADLVVIGGGLTGLWAALLAREQEPGREVVLLEGERFAFGASGRNGGFMDASLTHGPRARLAGRGAERRAGAGGGPLADLPRRRVPA